MGQQRVQPALVVMMCDVSTQLLLLRCLNKNSFIKFALWHKPMHIWFAHTLSRFIVGVDFKESTKLY